MGDEPMRASETDPPPPRAQDAAAGEAPLVSILLAVRDGARFLPQALASIDAQRYRPLELLAVDDGSTDDTGAILRAFAAARDWVRLLGTAGVGPSGARAVAFEASRGALIAIHDADDESLPDRIERQAAYLTEHPEIGVLGTHADVIDGRGRRVAAYRVPHGDAALRRMLRRAPPFVHGSVLMRREAYEEAGGFRAVFRCAEDYDLWLRIPPRFGLENLPQPLYHWRSHEGGTFARMRDQHIRFQAAARAFDEERRVVGRDAAALLVSAGGWEAFLEAYDRADRLALRWGEALVREGRTAEARGVLVRAMRHPRSISAALSWWLLSWPVGFLPRARRSQRRGADDLAPSTGGPA